MRAVFLDSDFSEKKMFIAGDEANHLIKVIRIKVREEILLLNGRGLKAYSRITSMGRKDLEVEIFKLENCQRIDAPDVLVGVPKKEYFENICRSITEIGVNRLYYCQSEYSQRAIKNSQRLDTIMVGSLIQSNNPFMPELQELEKLHDLVEIAKLYDHVIYFSLNAKDKTIKKDYASKKCLLIFGPEGGFSEEEENIISFLPNLLSIHLPLPILKAITAVPVGLGFVLGAR